MKLRVANWKPKPKQLTSYRHVPVGSSIKEPRRTVATRYENPFHEGLFEAMRGGARHAKSVCSGRAKNGSPQLEEVAVDRRTRASEQVRIKREGELGKFERRADVELSRQFD